MRDKINANMTAYLAFPPQRVAEETRAYEARLLGLPAPAADTSSEARAAALPAPEPRKTATEADGRFTFDHLPPGFYRVVAQREGYFRDAAAFGNFVETAISDGRSLDVGSEKTTGVTLSLTPGGVIAGRVQDTGGRPLANFTVAAYQVAYREGRAVLEEVRTAAAPTAVSAQTDDHGEYRIVWLPPGAYYVAANPRRPFVATNCSALFAAACSPPASPQDVYVRTFPSDVKDAQMALPITLAPGKTVTGVDIKVQADATAKVSGRIVNPFIDTNGQATTSSTSLYLVNRDPGTMEANRVRAFPNRAPKGSGLFEIHNVPPGSYEIWATAPDGNGRTAWGNARVEIGERDVENVAIAIKSGSSVKIRLSVDGGPPQSIEVRAPAGGEQRQQPANSDSPAATARGPAPVIRPAIQVRLTPLDFPEGAASSANAGMTFDPAGIYTFPNVPEGRYRVTVSSLTPTSYVEDIRQGISIYDEGFTMSNAPAEIDVIVRTRGGGAIRGTVTSIAGLSLTHSAVVVLVPSFPHRNNVTLYKMTETTPAGDFEIFPIVPGEYTLLAWERAPSGAWTNADFLARFEQRGKAVTIKADGYTMADVIVIPASQTN
jgi:hypothetical protein